jgi:hypothetical protein
LFDMAASALADLPVDPISTDRVMCLLFIARHSIYAGNAYAGLEPASQAVAMAGRLGDQQLRAKALKFWVRFTKKAAPIRTRSAR